MSFACILFAAICDLAAIQNGSKELYRSGEAFSVTGHVISANAKTRHITFWSHPNSIKFQGTADMLRARRDVRYRLDGRLALWKGWKKQILAERLTTVETNALPTPIDCTTSRITNGRNRKFVARIRGTIVKAAADETDPDYNWLSLKDEDGTISAFCPKRAFPIDELSRLVGADVRLSGVTYESVTWRSYLPHALSLVDKSEIEVVTPAETDPEKIPKFKSLQTIGRQSIEGSVVAHARAGFYMRFQPNGQGRRIALVIPSIGAETPSVGKHVTAAGFASLDGYHMRFDEAIVKVAEGAVPKGSGINERQIAAVSIPRLFTDESGHDKIAAGMHGELVRIRGTVRDLPPASADGRRIIVEDGGYRVGVDAALISGQLPDWIEDNAAIEATGILLVEYETAASAYQLPRFKRFTLLPRSAGDFRSIRRAPWWTPQRLFVVILVLLGVIVWIAIWNRALKRLSEKRGEELYRERIAHKAAELKVEERTRLAVEIHDSISQTLTGIALQFDNGADESVVRQMLSSCRHELKSCLWDLRSRTFEEKDMTEAVRRAIGPNAGNAKVDVRFNVPRCNLSESTTHAILRIVRELVINAIRHGNATEVKIAGESHDGVISFSVKDNGSGFDPARVAGPSTGHFGLQGVRERIAAFQGEINIDSLQGRGTKISITLKTPET